MPLYTEAMRAAMYPRGAETIPFVVIAWPTVAEYYSDRPYGFDGVKPFLPRVLEISPITFTAGLKPGAVSFPSASVLLDDTDGRLRVICEGGEEVAGSAASLGWAMPGLAPADWHTAFTGLIDKPEYEGSAIRIHVRAKEAPLRGTMPKAQLLKAEASLALETSWGAYLPLLYGEHDSEALSGKGMVPALNYMFSGAGACRYALCLGWAKAVNRVYLNGTLQTLTTHYTISHPIVGGKLLTSIDFVAATAADAVVTADAEGYETVGDGSGELILNPVDQLLHLLTNFAFGDWRLGAWLSPAEAQVDLASFSVAASYASTLGFEGGHRLGGTSETEQVLEVLTRWLSSWLPFRAYWTTAGNTVVFTGDVFVGTTGGKLGLRPLSHIFAGYTSPGPAAPSSEVSLFMRGPIHEIGQSFRVRVEPDVVRRVDLNYLYGAQDARFWQALAVQDVSQAEQASESFALHWSSPRLV